MVLLDTDDCVYSGVQQEPLDVARFNLFYIKFAKKFIFCHNSFHTF